MNQMNFAERERQTCGLHAVLLLHLVPYFSRDVDRSWLPTLKVHFNSNRYYWKMSRRESKPEIALIWYEIHAHYYSLGSPFSLVLGFALAPQDNPYLALSRQSVSVCP